MLSAAVREKEGVYLLFTLRIYYYYIYDEEKCFFVEKKKKIFNIYEI